jgi:hypothetical protein
MPARHARAFGPREIATVRDYPGPILERKNHERKNHRTSKRGVLDNQQALSILDGLMTAPPTGASHASARPLTTGVDRGGGLVPVLKLRMETVLVNAGQTLAPRYREEESAVAELWFQYGAARVGGDATAPDQPALASVPAPAIAHDREGERRARYLLESLGAVEIACLDEIETCPGSSAEYIVRVDGNVHALCSFTAYALPQLRGLGWQIELPPDYPFQVIAADVPWYAHVDDDAGERPGWFSLELGIEVAGRRVNLLPALPELLQQIAPSARLERLLPPGGRAFAVPTGDGRYLAVPPERLRILMKVLGELYQGEGGEAGFHFPATKAGSLGAIDAAFVEPGRAPLTWTGATAVQPFRTDRRRSFSSPSRRAAPGSTSRRPTR